MADRFLLESSAVDGFQLEDATGVVLLEATAGASSDVFIEGLHPIMQGMRPLTAAGLGGVLQE